MRIGNKDLLSEPKKERSPRWRVLLLLTQVESLLNSDTSRSIKLCLQATQESQKNKEPDLLAESLLMTGLAHVNGGHTPRGISYYNRALKLFKRIGDRDAILDTEYKLAFTKRNSGNMKDALMPLHKILQARKGLEIQSSSVRKKNEMIVARSWSDRIYKRIPTAVSSLKTNQSKIAAVLNLLALSYSGIGEQPKAIAFAEESLGVCRKIRDNEQSANALSTLGIIHLRLAKESEALRYFQKVLKLQRLRNDKIATAATLTNIASLYFGTKRPEKARPLAAEVIRIHRQTGQWLAECVTYTIMAEYELHCGSLAKASKLNDAALDLLKGKEKGLEYFDAALQHLQIEFKKHPSDEVYAAFIQLYNLAVKKAVERQYNIAQELLRISEELGKHKDAIGWLKKIHEYEMNRIDVGQKQAIAKLETTLELQRLEGERELHKIRTRQLESELQSRTREIELLASQLAKKGSFLVSLRDQLQSLKTSDEEGGIIAIDTVTGLIETMRHKDKEYEQLEERARNLYGNFFATLSKKFPRLTPAERKICILVKLGLNSKDIANVLFTSVRTIENHSLRIRKKLGIANTTRLSRFLGALDDRPMKSK
ncbi:MAG: tetratricopeptide repeat protein [Bacteroidota bacterium]|nr:tetratricopeptide repeat protein [Bacteroidota bacterium]